MSWENELKEEITFISPSMTFFSALWRGNERTFEKKLGMFDPPNFTGTIVQDLGAKSFQYPITAYFDGFFNGTDATDFADALREEKGVWTVWHPTKGVLQLILISCKEDIQPIENGNFTVFDMVWIAPANVLPGLSVLTLFDSILGAIVAIQDAMLIAQQLRTDAYGAVVAVVNAVNRIKGFVTAILEFPANTASIFKDLFDSAVANLTNATDNFGITEPDPTPVYNEITNLINIPAQVYTDFSQGFSLYSDVLDAIINAPIYGAGGEIKLNTSQDIEEARNKQIVKEFFLTASFTGMCQALVNATFQTRAEVITAVDNVTDFFNRMIDSMDEMQEYFSDLDIDEQFFAQTSTYQDLYNLYADTLRYLFLQIYSLNTEKRFTLKNARSPLEITVTEYGSLGPDDQYYDLFIKSNNLSGNDILLLPKDREVVIYT